jgi:hypothetical protein
MGKNMQRRKTDLQETVCRACTSSFLVDVSGDGETKSRVLSVHTHVSLERDGTDCYVRCPHCSAKNIAVVRTDPDGRQTVEVVCAVIDDM